MNRLKLLVAWVIITLVPGLFLDFLIQVFVSAADPAKPKLFAVTALGFITINLAYALIRIVLWAIHWAGLGDFY